MRTWKIKPIRIFVALGVLSAGVVRAENWDPKNNKPPEFAEAENHPHVRFLPEVCDWERLDIDVPRASTNEKLPPFGLCVLLRPAHREECQ